MWIRGGVPCFQGYINIYVNSIYIGIAGDGGLFSWSRWTIENVFPFGLCLIRAISGPFRSVPFRSCPALQYSQHVSSNVPVEKHEALASIPEASANSTVPASMQRSSTMPLHGTSTWPPVPAHATDRVETLYTQKPKAPTLAHPLPHAPSMSPQSTYR